MTRASMNTMLGAITPPYVSYPRAIKVCYPILYAIDNSLDYDIFFYTYIIIDNISYIFC